MIDKFQNTIDQKFPFLRNAKLYLAISGGKDSITLSSLLMECGMNHVLLHCNFQLRGKESDADEQFLKEYAQKNGLEIHVEKFNTLQIAEDTKMSIQECARGLRYEWFRTFLADQESSFLLTAHHLDDSIETFFINLLRGTGYRGLAGIPPLNGQIVRPLSDFTAREIYQYIDVNHLEYRSDSSNAKREYLRNKIRHDLIPAITDLEPDFQTKMATLFDDLNELKSHIGSEVYEFCKTYQKPYPGGGTFPLLVVRSLGPFMREQTFNRFGIHRKNGAEFSKFLNASTGSKFRTGSFEFLIDREKLVISATGQTTSETLLIISELPATVDLGDRQILLSTASDVVLDKNNGSIQQVDQGKIKFPLTLRNWKQGDRMRPLGMTGTKLVSDILIDRKISLNEKSKQLVIQDDAGLIVCLVGITISEDAKLSTASSQVLEVWLT